MPSREQKKAYTKKAGSQWVPRLNECLRRRVTLPHPAGCSTITVPGLSFRVRKGTGRHTWAMATAKTTTDGPDPQNRDPDRPKGKTTHAPPPARAVTVREPDSGREHRFVTTGTTLLVANNPAAAKTRTHPHTQEGEWAAMSPSPVSTGRLHGKPHLFYIPFLTGSPWTGRPPREDSFSRSPAFGHRGLLRLLSQRVYGQINVYGVTTKSERCERSYRTRSAAGNGIGGREAPVPYGS